MNLLLIFCMVLARLWATYDIAIDLLKIIGMVLGFGVFFEVVSEPERQNGSDIIRLIEGL